MIHKTTIATVAAMLLSCAAQCVTADWQAPPVEEVKAKTLSWLEEKKADEPAKAKAAEIWAKVGQQPTELELLSAFCQTVAIVDPAAAALVDLCAKPKEQYKLPDQGWLFDAATAPLVATNFRVFYGRWLAQDELFDEAMAQLEGIQPGEVIAPATLLFYQGVAQHTLLEREAGLKTLAELIEGEKSSPKRYVALAKLMEEDLKALKDESLDHISRRMGDVRRRLDLGRAGKKVRDVEDGIVESLDKIIKKLEEQQQQSSSGGGLQDSIRSSSPAPDSLPIGGKGPGEVTKKNIGSSDDWGALPPKEREEALQKIGRDFPSHYRDVIEQYFRRLAAEGEE